jgi:hypothetical protein
MADNDFSTVAPAYQIAISELERQAFFQVVTLTFPCFKKSHYPRELCGFTKSLMQIKRLCCELLIANQEESDIVIQAFTSQDYGYLIKLGLEQLYKSKYPIETYPFLESIKNIWQISSAMFCTAYPFRSVEHEYFYDEHHKLSRLLGDISFYLSAHDQKLPRRAGDGN